jgi:hypothetical protein
LIHTDLAEREHTPFYASPNTLCCSRAVT